MQEYEKHLNKLLSKRLPSPSVKSSATTVVHRSDGSALRVYTDIPQIEEFLTRPEFVISMCYRPCRENFTNVHFFASNHKSVLC